MGAFFGRKNREQNEQDDGGFRKSITASKIGSQTRLSALRIEVEKSTHKTSYISAESANINKHMGLIEGGDVSVKHLKGGKIIANTVYVDFFASGEVEANHIHINRLGSKNKIVITDTLEINKIEGSGNIIAVKPNIDLEQFGELTKLCEKIRVFKKQLAEMKDILTKKSQTIEEKGPAIQECKKKIAKNTEKGELPNADLLVAVKEFDIQNREYDKFMSVVYHLEHNIKNEEDKLMTLCDKFVFGGRVISNSLWKSGNSIIFILPGYDIEHKTDKNENAHEIYIRYSAEKEFSFEIEIRKKEHTDDSRN